MRTLTQKLSGDTAIDPISLWERMSIDEYAELEKMMGEKLLKKEGIWWRPCTYATRIFASSSHAVFSHQHSSKESL